MFVAKHPRQKKHFILVLFFTFSSIYFAHEITTIDVDLVSGRSNYSHCYKVLKSIFLFFWRNSYYLHQKKKKKVKKKLEIVNKFK